MHENRHFFPNAAREILIVSSQTSGALPPRLPSAAGSRCGATIRPLSSGDRETGRKGSGLAVDHAALVYMYQGRRGRGCVRVRVSRCGEPGTRVHTQRVLRQTDTPERGLRPRLDKIFRLDKFFWILATVVLSFVFDN